MSFSSEIKKQLSSVGAKKQCCISNTEKGKTLSPFAPQCEKDAGMYLRGVFLKYGSVTPPGRNFMLCFRMPDISSADAIDELLTSASLPPKRSFRQGKPILYYKASESIEDVLSFIGGTKAALDIMNENIMSDVRNRMNRICNAETANLDRTAKAAAEQCDAIRLIIKCGVLQNLPAELRECAEIRIDNPDKSLEEIRLLLSNPVSKSGLNHRFKKLMEIAESCKQ